MADFSVAFDDILPNQFRGKSELGKPRTILYVRSTGDDDNDGLTVGTALRTIQKALSKLPLVIEGAEWVIDATDLGTETITEEWGFPQFLGSHSTHSTTTDPDYIHFNLRPPVSLRAIPTTVFTPTITGSTTDSVTGLRTYQTSDTFTPNEHKGRFLLGTGLIEYAVIVSNTASDIVVSAIGNFTSPVIAEPSCELMIGANPRNPYAAGFQINTLCSVQFAGIKFSKNDSGDFGHFRTNSDLYFTFCDMGWGLPMRDGGGGITWGEACWFHDGLMADQYHTIELQKCYLDGTTGVGLTINNHNSAGNRILEGVAEGIVGLGHTGNAEYHGSFNIDNCWILNPTSHGITYHGGPICGVTKTRIEGAGGSAIWCNSHGRLNLSNIADNHGSNPNTRYGIEIVDGAHVIIPTSAVQGTLGVRFEENPQITGGSQNLILRPSATTEDNIFGSCADLDAKLLEIGDRAARDWVILDNTNIAPSNVINIDADLNLRGWGIRAMPNQNFLQVLVAGGVQMIEAYTWDGPMDVRYNDANVQSPVEVIPGATVQLSGGVIIGSHPSAGAAFFTVVGDSGLVFITLEDCTFGRQDVVDGYALRGDPDVTTIVRQWAGNLLANSLDFRSGEALVYQHQGGGIELPQSGVLDGFSFSNAGGGLLSSAAFLEIDGPHTSTFSVFSGSLGNYDNRKVFTLDPSGGGFLVNLPALTGGPDFEGAQMFFKNITNSSNPVTITADGSELIEGASTFAMTQPRQAVRVVAISTTEWIVI